MSISKVNITITAFIFSEFVLVGTQNSNLSQILFGQKFPKTATVYAKAGQFRTPDANTDMVSQIDFSERS